MFEINRNLQKQISLWNLHKGVHMAGHLVIIQILFFFLLLFPTVVWPYLCIQIREMEIKPSHKVLASQVIKVCLMVEFAIQERKSSIWITKCAASYKENFQYLQAFWKSSLSSITQICILLPLNNFIWLSFQRRHGY